MPHRPSKREIALQFRSALLNDCKEAERILSRSPLLIDEPVYGDSESALHFFAVENEEAIVRWLLAHGANPDGIASDDSPLHGAAQLGHLAVCEVLLVAGANPNRQDFVGETALHKASEKGDLEIIRLLLKHGADPNIPEMCGELPIESALPREREKVEAIFKEWVADSDAE